MELIETIGGITGVIAFLLCLGLFFYTAISGAVSGVGNAIPGSKAIGNLFVSREEKERLAQFYTNRFPYYKLLDEKEKKEFVSRVITFRKQNQLHIKHTVISSADEIELMINAAFVQITFGYNDFHKMNGFNRIVIYPSTFFSKLINRQVKGLTVSSGFIHYSWKDFIKGYKDENDRINLGLHELAHVFYLETFSSEDFDWSLWKTKALAAIVEERKLDQPFFRSYGQTNLSEFWAVVVEYFFEDPVAFNNHYKGLYIATSVILKQDMALRKYRHKP